MKLNQEQNIERVLESAVVVRWADLMRGTERGLIQGFAQVLAVVMQHQHAFALPPNLGRQGLLQITTPTELESIAAVASVRSAVDGVNFQARRASAGHG